MGKFARLGVLIAVAAVLVVPQWAFAQSASTTGQVIGETKDGGGGILPGVTVQVTNPETGFSRRAITDGSGFYRLDLLPPGTYDVRADLAGFKSETKRGVRVGLGSVVNMTFLLQASAIEDEIVVTAEAPVVETTNPSIAMSVSDEAIANLPLQGRDFSDFAILTPGTVNADKSQQSGRGGLQMGARAVQNSFNIDGSNNQSSFFGEERGGTRPPFTFSQAAIKEFQVIKSSYNLQFNSSGGVINAITKSGTNTFAGQVFGYYTDDGMRSRDAKGREANSFEQKQFGFALGGPVVKDKLHFFLSYDGQRYKTPYFAEFASLSSVVGETNLFPTEAAAIAEWERRTGLVWANETGQIDQTNDADVFLAKLDWQVSSSNLASIRVNSSAQEAENGTASFTNTSRSSNGFEENSFISAVASLNSVLSDSAFNEFIVQYSAEERPRTPNNTTLPHTALLGYNGDWGQQNYLPNSLDEDRIQFIDNFSYYLGAHTLKAGVNLDFATFDNVYFRYQSGYYIYNDWTNFFNDTPRQYQQAFSPYNGQVEFDVDFYALYLQDEWRVNPNFTLTYGVRYDLQKNPTPEVFNRAYPDTAQIPDDKDNFAPRVGFAWDLAGDGKSVLRGGFGYFYDITPTLLLSNAMNDNGMRTVTIVSRCDQGQECPPAYPDTWESQGSLQSTGRASIKVVDPDFENPETWRVSLGYEREVMTDLSLGVDVIYSESDKLERSQDQNLARIAGATPDGAPMYQRYLPQYPQFSDINQYTSDIEAEYKAVVLKARKRYSNGWMLDASYTWSEAEDSNSNERSTTSYPWDQFDLARSWGPADFDTTHKFVLSASYSLPWDFLVSGIFYFRSGFPYTALHWTDTNGDGQRNEPALVANSDGTFTRFGRNTFNHPDYMTLDLRLSKAFRFGRSMAAELIFDVFNVTNEDNWYVGGSNRYFYNSTGTALNPNFGKDSEIGDPRSYQLGAKFTF